MKDYEIHLPAKKRKLARQEERPVIRISSEAYNTLVEIGNESTLSFKDIASILILEAAKHVVYDKEE